MHTRTLRLGAVGAAIVAGLLAATPAGAATTPPDGIANLGSAAVTTNGQTDSISPLAPCDVDGQTTANSSGGAIAGTVSFGGGTTSCTRDTTANTTASTANGTRFQLDALVPYGGPRIRIASYQVSCTATTGGTSAGWSFSGLSGITGLPQQIPANYTMPITGSDGTHLADAIFDEVLLPNPNDGSIALNLLHIKLFPDGGPTTGDILVGSTACAPTF
jgi:hypothetical protein